MANPMEEFPTGDSNNFIKFENSNDLFENENGMYYSSSIVNWYLSFGSIYRQLDDILLF